MPSSYRDALAYLDTLTNLGIKPGLERMQSLVRLIGDPQTCAPVVHITGTNGKTSTARMISAILQASGMRTGTYTSPHLQVVNERIAVDLEPLDEEYFARAFDDALVAVQELRRLEGKDPSYFEMVTLMAFAAFADAPVGVQVVEVGMGGRWDATNVAHADVAVVTNVSLDHVEYLGSTPPLIAAEKAGIIKKGTDLVVGETDPEVVAVFRKVAADTNAGRVHERGTDFDLEDRKLAVGGQVVSVEGIFGRYDEIFIPLFGRHQALNASVAVAACEALLDRALHKEVLEEAFAGISSPGRLEVVARHPMVVLDGAHNPAGIRACLDALFESFAFERLHVVFGVFADKDYLSMLAELAPRCHSLFSAQTSLARSAPSDAVALAARKAGAPRVEAFGSVEAALDAARRQAGENDLVLVTGSLYVVGEARTHLVGLPDV